MPAALQTAVQAGNITAVAVCPDLDCDAGSTRRIAGYSVGPPPGAPPPGATPVVPPPEGAPPVPAGGVVVVPEEVVGVVIVTACWVNCDTHLVYVGCVCGAGQLSAGYRARACVM